MKTLYLTLLLLLIGLVSLKSQELGYINDSDGYTNLRAEPSSKSDIIGIITTGQEFKYQPDKSSDWWKVNFKFRSGYIHKSRVQSFNEIEKQISKFYQSYYSSDRNNAELGQGNNEKLFLLAQDYPLATLKAFCKQTEQVQLYLLSEFDSPVHDLIDLQLIYSRLISVEYSCPKTNEVLNAIKKAGQKLGWELKSIKHFENEIADYNKPEKHPTISNQWFASELNDKPITFYLNHPEIDKFSKMFYQGQFAVSDDTNTFAFLDSVLTNNLETRHFYLFVFNSVLRVTDGALSESIGSECKAYLEKYPCDFIAIKSNKLYLENYKKWIDFAAFEFYFNQDPIGAINKSIDTLKLKVQTDCKNQLAELENIRTKLIEFIKVNE